MKFRRLTDKIRLIADELWAQGNKDLSMDIHEVARKAEEARKARDEEYRRYPGAVLTRKKTK